jgi:hypothetical protein
VGYLQSAPPARSMALASLSTKSYCVISQTQQREWQALLLQATHS